MRPSPDRLFPPASETATTRLLRRPGWVKHFLRKQRPTALFEHPGRGAPARCASREPRPVTIALYLLGIVFIAATLVPLSRHPAWWVRACDFPRLQIVAGLAGVLAAGRGRRRSRRAGPAAAGDRSARLPRLSARGGSALHAALASGASRRPGATGRADAQSPGGQRADVEPAGRQAAGADPRASARSGAGARGRRVVVRAVRRRGGGLPRPARASARQHLWPPVLRPARADRAGAALSAQA